MGYSYSRCQRGLWGKGSLVMVHGPDHYGSPGIVLGLWYGGVSHLRVLVGEEELKCVNPLCSQDWDPMVRFGTYFIELDPDHPNYEAVEQKKHARRRRKDWEEETRRRTPPGPRKKCNRNVKAWLT